PYEVILVGRWSELDAQRPTASTAPSATSHAAGPTPSTPLAGQRWEFDIEDADGRRRLVLQSVVSGRRYAIGKGEGCDLRVNGSYTSRRHAEVWREQDAWWVADAGSTNGVRIEAAPLAGEASGGAACVAAVDQPARLPDGARIVLSARTEGPASDYPWLALRVAPPAMRTGAPIASRITPIASVPDAALASSPAAAAPPTPLTAIHLAADSEPVYKLTAFQVGGVHALEVRPSALPVSLGRSRSQSLVVDRRHEGVSGHHLDIVELDAAGAQVLVHGDNGVLVDGVPHAAGARLRWRVGETMVLGGAVGEHASCTLTLSRKTPGAT
ncbi:MAG: FHA domain-containing protein, partial [Burkholderiaceae bacterium]